MKRKVQESDVLSAIDEEIQQNEDGIKIADEAMTEGNVKLQAVCP